MSTTETTEASAPDTLTAPDNQNKPAPAPVLGLKPGDGILVIERRGQGYRTYAGLAMLISMNESLTGSRGEPSVEAVFVNTEALRRYGGSADWHLALVRAHDVVHYTHRDFEEGRASMAYMERPGPDAQIIPVASDHLIALASRVMYLDPDLDISPGGVVMSAAKLLDRLAPTPHISEPDKGGLRAETDEERLQRLLDAETAAIAKAAEDNQPTQLAEPAKEAPAAAETAPEPEAATEPAAEASEPATEAPAAETPALSEGTIVRFAGMAADDNNPPRAITAIVEVNGQTMVELEGMSGQFAEHLFVLEPTAEPVRVG